MEVINFTAAAIDAIPSPAAGRMRYKDVKRPNLFLYVTPAARTFYMVARRDGRLHEERLGAWPAFKVEDARRKVDEMLGAIERGEDPRGVGGRRRKGDTLDELFTWWLTSHAEPNLRPRSSRAAKNLYNLYVKKRLGHRTVASITRGDVAALGLAVSQGVKARGRHGDGERYKGVHSANDAIAMVGRVIRHAITMGRYTGADPTTGAGRRGEEPRDRTLSPGEFPDLIAALDRAVPRIRDLAKLILWTGARPGNVMAMCWDHVDFDRREWRIPRTKSGKPQTIYLHDQVLALLKARRADVEDDEPWVFPARHGHAHGEPGPGHMVAPHRAWKLAVADAGMPDLRLHDLRRSHGSWMLHHGAPIKVVADALGHANTRITERAYAFMLNQDPLRAAQRATLDAMNAAMEARPEGG